MGAFLRPLLQSRAGRQWLTARWQGYHVLGHSLSDFWAQHKHHHKFYNPTPFSVIADEWADQIARSSPLFLFPLVMPVNYDLLFFQFAVFFYGYGTYLHLGHEVRLLSCDNPVINTSFQH